MDTLYTNIVTTDHALTLNMHCLVPLQAMCLGDLGRQLRMLGQPVVEPLAEVSR